MSDTVRTLADHARPAWDLFREAFPAAEITDLITDLLHLADIDSDTDGTDVLDRATRDWEAERSDPSSAAG
ncbi:hypothetical protein [Streptomyces sp. NPDC004435]|uniref:hypothetical protein n=1 Tax=Streptomyces sp. NPDC004435 TaxID=3364701 RepID=UPI0036C3613E